MRGKPSDQVRRDALKVAKDKLDSGCNTCAEGYLHLAEQHGATRRDVLRAGLGSLIGVVGGVGLTAVTASAASSDPAGVGGTGASPAPVSSPRPPWYATQDVLNQKEVVGTDKALILARVRSGLLFPIPTGPATSPAHVVRSELKSGQHMISVGEAIGQGYALAHYERSDGVVTDILFDVHREGSGEATALKATRVRNGSQVLEVKASAQSTTAGHAAPAADYCYCGTCRYCGDLNYACATVCCGACYWAGPQGWFTCFLALCYGCYWACCSTWTNYCCNCSPY